MELGKTKIQKKDFNSAADNFMKIAFLYENNSFTQEALYLGGTCFENLSQPNKALKLYKELLNRFPNSTYKKEVLKRTKSIEERKR